MSIKIHYPAIAIGITAMLGGSCSQEKDQGPNVIFILADDYGWAQSGAYGSQYYHTPNIDRLAGGCQLKGSLKMSD